MSNCRVMCFRAFSFVSYSVYRPIFCLMCMICVSYSCEKIVKENRTMFCYHFLLVFFYFPSSTFSSNSFSSYTSSSSPFFHFFHSLIHIFSLFLSFLPFLLVPLLAHLLLLHLLLWDHILSVIPSLSVYQRRDVCKSVCL